MEQSPVLLYTCAGCLESAHAQTAVVGENTERTHNVKGSVKVRDHTALQKCFFWPNNNYVELNRSLIIASTQIAFNESTGATAGRPPVGITGERQAMAVKALMDDTSVMRRWNLPPVKNNQRMVIL